MPWRQVTHFRVSSLLTALILTLLCFATHQNPQSCRYFLSKKRTFFTIIGFCLSWSRNSSLSMATGEGFSLLWSPTSLLSNGNRWLYPRAWSWPLTPSSAEVKNCGAIPALLHTYPWHGIALGQIYMIFFCIMLMFFMSHYFRDLIPDPADHQVPLVEKHWFTVIITRRYIEWLNAFLTSQDT
jgi:hypothetical protein